MNLDDAVKQRTGEPRLDFFNRAPKRAAPTCTGGTGGVTGEELQFRRARRERGEFDRQVLDRAGGRSLLEPDREWCQNAGTIGRGIFEYRFGHPGRALLEAGASADGLHPPADPARMAERLLDQTTERVGKQLAVGEWAGKIDADRYGLGSLVPDHRLGNPPRRQPPGVASFAPELGYHG